jgi:beta-glucosidase
MRARVNRNDQKRQMMRGKACGLLGLGFIASATFAPAANAQFYGEPMVPSPAALASVRTDVPVIAGPWQDRALPPERRAELLVRAMTRDEKLLLVRGFNGGFLGGRSTDPLLGPMQRMTSGYVPGVPRLGIPAIHMNDAGIGVGNGFDASNARPGDEATAFPAFLALTATFEPQLAMAMGNAVAKEFRARGMNMVLGPGLNLSRDARGGRNFEYLGGEDPLLAGTLAGWNAKGIQSAGVMANLKHYAIHDQTKASDTVDARISEAALRESDLLAFELAIESGRPASVMCAYNFVNGVRACHSDFLNNVVLKGQWRWPGFILSDWGAVHDTVGAALGGLDQQSAWPWDRNTPYFGPKALGAALDAGQIPASRLDDMVGRILWGMISSGVYDDPPRPGGVAGVDKAGHIALARRIAERGMVLLKNEGNLLPLTRDARSIALIGGRADLGVLTGGGSSAVIGYGGVEKPDGSADPKVPRPTVTADGRPILPARNFGGAGIYLRSSPLEALRAAGGAVVTFDAGVDLVTAAAAARKAKIAVVVVNQVNAEGSDPASITLPGEQNRLVDAVAAANSNTVVLVQSGNPIAMPWLDRVKAVLVTWYPGQDGGAAIADVLFGKVSPSGRLPVTFPRDPSQQPRPVWPGSETEAAPAPPAPATSPNLLAGDGRLGVKPPAPDRPAVPYNYDVEGADVGYRWYARTGRKPLFPFGYGLSYTSFAYSDLRVTGGDTVRATFKVTNTGKRSGADVPQLYVTPPGGKRPLRLGGWQKVDLAPGESRQISIAVEPRILADYDPALARWFIAAGQYRVMLAKSAGDAGITAHAALGERSMRP